MEIEWGRGPRNLKEEVLVDFYKLVQAKADLRVLVFQGPAPVAPLLDELEKRFRGFRLTTSGDRYLLVGYEWDTGKTNVRLVIV
jgi:hypothetical protein